MQLALVKPGHPLRNPRRTPRKHPPAGKPNNRKRRVVPIIEILYVGNGWDWGNIHLFLVVWFPQFGRVFLTEDVPASALSLGDEASSRCGLWIKSLTGAEFVRNEGRKPQIESFGSSHPSFLASGHLKSIYFISPWSTCQPVNRRGILLKRTVRVRPAASTEGPETTVVPPP